MSAPAWLFASSWLMAMVGWFIEHRACKSALKLAGELFEVAYGYRVGDPELGVLSVVDWDDASRWLEGQS